MKITKEDVMHVAELARIDLSDDDIDVFAEQIGDILDYVDQLKGVPTEGVAPTSHAISLTNAFRDDEVCEPADPGRALENAPESQEGYFIVPKIID
jgi:aspartyl-tRNA(Asn)/glutamyl-tRNA(Gln) amidotransferase subunit C